MDGWVFLRPWWLLAYLPVLMVGLYLWLRPQSLTDWQKKCDPRLLEYLKYTQGNHQWFTTWACLMTSLILIVFGLSGPSWKKLPAPVGQLQQPVMVVLDLSTNMLLDDITPSRLERAKLLIEDSLKARSDMQWGLIVFSEQPFLVSPLSSDIENILNFLPVLSPKILPVGGYDILSALKEAEQDIERANMAGGRILVISSKKPTPTVLSLLSSLSQKGYAVAWVNDSSIPNAVKQPKNLNIFDIKSAPEQITSWLRRDNMFNARKIASPMSMLQWQDQGRWFLLLALWPLVLVFRKGWFLRLWV